MPRTGHKGGLDGSSGFGGAKRNSDQTACALKGCPGLLRGDSRAAGWAGLGNDSGQHSSLSLGFLNPRARCLEGSGGQSPPSTNQAPITQEEIELGRKPRGWRSREERNQL